MTTKQPRIEANGYFYTAVAATDDEERRMREAYSAPMIVFGNYLPPDPAETVHAVALLHGLPEIRGHYGYDFKQHEFIRLADATQGEPDRWPSRKLSDVLARAGLSAAGAPKESE
jgi:hypothetical protein